MCRLRLAFTTATTTPFLALAMRGYSVEPSRPTVAEDGMATLSDPPAHMAHVKGRDPPPGPLAVPAAAHTSACIQELHRNPLAYLMGRMSFRLCARGTATSATCPAVFVGWLCNILQLDLLTQLTQGLSNQRIAFETACVMAKLLDRVLPAPPPFPPRAHTDHRVFNTPNNKSAFFARKANITVFRGFHFTDYFDLGPWAKHVTFVHPDLFRAHLPPEEQTLYWIDEGVRNDLMCPTMYVDTKTNPGFQARALQQQARKHLRTVGLDELAMQWKPYTHVMFSVMFACMPTLLSPANKKLDLLHLLPSSSVLQMGRQVADWITTTHGAYVSLHYRAGDGTFKYWPGRKEANAKDMISFAAKKKIRTIYLATDDNDGNLVSALQALPFHPTVLTFDSVFHITKNLPKRLWASVEQVICALGLAFQGTKPSTFSEYIAKVRADLAANLVK
eukprot:gene10430-1892_t